MGRCEADPTIDRKEIAGFKFPLGVYPIEEMTPRAGYSVEFEPADGDDDGEDWEEWPDRYMLDIAISADRIEALCRSLFGMLPGRVYPILDILGVDAFREVDPYVAYDRIGLDRFTDSVRRYRAMLFEDGLCGFGAMSEDPFFYVFIDEHKMVTVRVEPERKEQVERILHAFDLEPVDTPAGADASAHEHRGVVHAPEDRRELMTPEEIIEALRDDWDLVLNIDPERNLDDDGNDLGVTSWRCLVRGLGEGEKGWRYLEVLLHAGCLREAEELSLKAIEDAGEKREITWDDIVVVSTDRVLPKDFVTLVGKGKAAKIARTTEPGIVLARSIE